MNKHHRVWSLQEAKAKFSEVVRLAQTEGPQTVTVHGKEVVTITKTKARPAEVPNQTGLDLLRALQSCPYPEVFDEIDRLRVREPVILKDVDFG
jgi:prevent-host-death family protein